MVRVLMVPDRIGAPTVLMTCGLDGALRARPSRKASAWKQARGYQKGRRRRAVTMPVS